MNEHRTSSRTPLGVVLSDGYTKEALPLVDGVEIVGEDKGDDGHELHEDVQGRARSVLRERERRGGRGGRGERERERGDGRDESGRGG